MFKALASHGRICGKWFVKGPKANLAAYHKKRHLAHHVMHPHVAHPACAGFLMLVHLSVQTQITAVGHRTPLPINVYANKPRKLDLAHYCLCQQNMCDDIPLLFFPAAVERVQASTLFLGRTNTSLSTRCHSSAPTSVARRHSVGSRF